MLIATAASFLLSRASPCPVFDTGSNGQWVGRPTNEVIASVGTHMLA